MNARQVAGLLLIAACVIFVGICDKQDAEAESQRYCDNVRKGAWPDYERGRYKKECGGEDAPKFNENLAK